MKSNSISKFICLILRHKPNTIGITLDQNGWVNTQELLNGLNAAGKKVDIEQLINIVNTDNKRRFSFNSDKSKIRANQGHSIPVNLGLLELVPPTILYHGTSEKFIESIKQNGIQKRSRQYVHLSSNIETAVAVGKRHGNPIVLKINTEQMFLDGYKFYLSENGVWLTDNVPYQYVLS
ncbi:MAG: RNA 2'-phosphotransferase [Clostridia bacterium]|nr:RNA 2'-phosphotransferase [Clostridia bacterium]